MSDSPVSQADLERLAADLGDALRERGWHMGTAESCTGGWIAQAMTAIAGSSDCFEGGLVTYSNSAKVELLGVPAMILERHGAVSGETALAMVNGARERLGVEVAVAVTGVAGPGGGSADKPVGTVWFGFSAGSGAAWSDRQVFAGERSTVRALTVAHALRTLLTSLS